MLLMNSTTLTYNYQVPLQIRMSDLDPFGHVNNGAQCHYFDFGRGSYFECVFDAPINWLTLDLIMVHSEFDFKAEIEFHDSIVCETRVVEIGHKSMKMVQQLRDVRTDVIKTVCHTVLCGFDRKNHISIPICEEYRAKIDAFENISHDQQG